MKRPSNIRRLRLAAELVLALLGLTIGFIVPGYCLDRPFPGLGTTALVTNSSWVPTGNLNTPRRLHTATRLQDGKVLVVGGRDNDGNFLNSAELYDPATGAWSITGSLSTARIAHTATLLQSGKVLAAGGGVPPSPPNTAEVYDPATGTWSATGSLAAAHSGHAAILIPNGKVLVVGGTAGFSMLNNAELYDPVAGTWGPAGNPTWSRIGHTATLLQNGSVLVAGGIVGPYDADIEFPAASTAELYDPGSGSWRTVGSAIRLYSHTATLLPSGKVLMAGGFNVQATCAGCLAVTRRDAELYDPAGEAWSFTGSLLVGHVGHTASLSPSGKVLVAGGGFDGADGEAELYDPDSGLWTATSSLSVGRAGHRATLLLNGNVLVEGGTGVQPALNSAELYEDVAPPVTIGPGFTGAWYDPAQSGHGLFVEILPNNRVFVGWFTFNPAGTQQAWFVGVGTYSGNTATITPVSLPTGGRWIPNFDPSQILNNPWGTLTLTFTDRDHGKVDFNSVLGYGTGSMSLTRLTQPAGFSPLATSIGPAGAVAADKFGSVYFSSPNLVFKLDSQGSLTRVAGNVTAGYSGDGGPATQALLNFPSTYPEMQRDPIDFSELVGGLAVDSAGNLYIADAYNNRVRKVDSNGIITTVAGDGTRGNSGDGGLATNARFWWPQGVARDSASNLYIADSNGTLRKVTPDGIIATLTRNNCGPGFLGPGLCAPEEIAVDSGSNVYVTDGYCRVREVRRDGSVFTVAGDDRHPSHGFAFTCGYYGDGAPATSAALEYPYSVAVDGSGNLYIADTYNSCIRKVDTVGVITTIAGACTSPGFSGDGGPATSARLNLPHGVAVDTAGTVYVADTGNNRLRKISPDGTVTTVAGDGSTKLYELAASGTIGPAFTGAWYDPTQSGHGLFVEVLPDNRLFVGWFTFNPAGTQQAWFVGVGTYSGNTATITPVSLPTGGRWIPNFDPNQIVNNLWGTLTFTFTDCNHGKVDFNSVLGYGTGNMNLTRLTQPAGLTCP